MLCQWGYVIGSRQYHEIVYVTVEKKTREIAILLKAAVGGRRSLFIAFSMNTTKVGSPGHKMLEGIIHRSART